MIVVEMCKNIPTTIAKMISKFKELRTDSEKIPVINPRGVVTANNTIINQIVVFLMLAETKSVIKAIETGIWWKMIPIKSVLFEPW